MKNILIAFDGTSYSSGAIDFAIRLNDISPITLTGIFLPQVNFDNLWSYSFGGDEGSMFIPMIEGSETLVIEKNIKTFQETCIKNNVRHRVHRDLYDFALPQFKQETRFADLLLIGGEVFYRHLGTANRDEFLKAALRGVECPVLLVPEHFQFPENNIFAYDGSKSSVYAIKQFCYLFPPLCENKTTVIYVDDDPEAAIPYEKNIKELLSRHFSKLSYTVLDFSGKRYFSTWVSEQKNAILVSGSFGRSALSQFFSKSYIMDAIRDHRLPVFVAHC